jgi:WD40 repeat protein
LCLSPDEEKLYSAGADALIKVWNTLDYREILSLKGHTDEITSLRIEPKGEYLFSGSKDNTLKLWNLSMLNLNEDSN